MECQETALEGVKILKPAKHGDPRGYFSETYTQRSLAAVSIDAVFVQDNQSYSVEVGTLRGLHFQAEPSAQAKLVRVLRGRILDVVVDIRRGSPTFGKHVAVEISAAAWNQIFVPVGFAHGLLTLEPNTEVFYKVTGFYSSQCDRGILWNDPALGIEWPLPEDRIILSEKDRHHPVLAELAGGFTY